MRNNILLFISFFWVVLSFAQDVTPVDLNFMLEDDKKVTWQKVYVASVDVDSLASDSLTKILKVFLKNNFFTNALEESDNGFIGQSSKVKLSSTKGIAMGAFTPYIAFVKIDVKDNKYRVSVTDITFDPTEVGVSSGGITISSANPFTLEDFVVKNRKDEFRKNKTAFHLLTIINKDLSNYFTLTKGSSKDDW